MVYRYEGDKREPAKELVIELARVQFRQRVLNSGEFSYEKITTQSVVPHCGFAAVISEMWIVPAIRVVWTPLMPGVLELGFGKRGIDELNRSGVREVLVLATKLRRREHLAARRVWLRAIF